MCVPKNLRKEVLVETHDSSLAGHLGVSKTISRVAKCYYWPGMFRDVAKYVRSCLKCQRYKKSQQQTPGLMLRPSINIDPWEIVSSDFVGPFPRSRKGNNFLVVFQDRFTKWIYCKAIRKANAPTVCKIFYEEIVTRFGPKIEIIDNGVHYDSKKFKDLMKDLGIFGMDSFWKFMLLVLFHDGSSIDVAMLIRQSFASVLDFHSRKLFEGAQCTSVQQF